MTPTKKATDEDADALGDEWTTPDATDGDPSAGDLAGNADQNEAVTAAPEGKLKVEATAYVTIGTTTYGPTAEGKTIEVPDNAESRAALAAGFLRAPTS